MPPLTRNCNDNHSNSDNENVNKLLSLFSRTSRVPVEGGDESEEQSKEKDNRSPRVIVNEKSKPEIITLFDLPRT